VRLWAVASASVVLLHLARAPEVILLPDPAQDLWPVPAIRLPTADLTLVEGSVMAVLGMIDCGQRHYRPGEELSLPVRAIGDRMKAVALSESWFMHRAVSENSDGSRDLGIAQASAPTRSRIRVLYVRGPSDFGLADDEYFDPWKATRALVYWFSLLLEDTSGDLDAATRAYNVGAARALAGRGAAYLEGVRRREREFVRGPGSSPSWRWRRAYSTSPCPPPGEEPLGAAPGGGVPSPEPS
jgi:hypothetical protein